MKRVFGILIVLLFCAGSVVAGPLDDVFSLFKLTGKAVAVCKDSDGGYDLSKASEYSNYGSYGQEKCLNDNQVMEAVCKDNDLVKYTVSCPQHTKCENGACIKLDFSSALCADTDGFNLYTAGEYYLGGAKTKEKCEDAKSLYEFSCVGDVLKKELMQCPSGFGCVEGACTKVDCVDSDGKNIEVTGKYKVGELEKSESCDSESSVLEYFCDDGVLRREIKDCPSGMKCIAGSCKKQEAIPRVCDQAENKLKQGESFVFHDVKVTVTASLDQGAKVLVSGQDLFLALGEAVDAPGLRLTLEEVDGDVLLLKAEALKCEKPLQESEVVQLRKENAQLRSELARAKKCDTILSQENCKEYCVPETAVKRTSFLSSLFS